MAITTKAGAMVMARRNQSGMVKRTKPCITTCPARVPTTVEEMPDATRERPNRVAAACPNKGVSVW
ncbi:hypothetical protein D3C84_893120 [compost metagenome]